jgi:hypothetical protein
MGIAFMSLLVAAVSGAPSEPQHDPQEECRRVTAAFQAKRYQEAMDLASHIVDAHPRSEFAIYAENTLLDSLKASGRWQ